ncbi:hypothetical protein TWF703_010442 [Orbilia oligospora]|uniref:Uncharacterized protein n=1 Tax=Orbilia oligospora TaxID=2813651 RepID=A0A7C8JYH8_ORBOL|nr:hypothetical protein TWF703_010442 [Orbilia oligospora]
MSEASHGHQANEAATPIQFPTGGKLNIHEASGIASGSETSSPEAFKTKVSTFSVLSLDQPRRRALSPNTFDSNAISYPQVSSGASHPTIQLSHESPNHSVRKLSATSVGEASGQSSPRQKENQKFSPELKKQLESLIAPDSRTTPQSSAPSTVSKSSRLGGWSIGTSSIALRPSEPVPSIVTTQLWEPEGTPEGSSESTESDRVPTPLSMSGCSDKSWHLLQKLKGKIVEMHNAGLHSSRSSSRNSISSRKSRSPARPLAENQQPRTRAASESGGNRTRLDPSPSSRSKLKAATVSGGTLRTSASNLKRVLIAEPNSTAIPINNLQRRSSTHRGTIIAVTPERGQHTPNRLNQASEQTSEGQKEPTGLSGLTRPIEFASNIFQSLITVASGGSPKSTPVSPDRGGASGTNVSKLQDKGKPPQLTNQDSSEDEMTFMEYIKKFSDSSPTGTPKYPPFSAPSCDILAAEVQPEFSNTVKQAAPRTVTFKDPIYDNIRRGAAHMSPIQEAESSEEIPPEIALDPGTGKTLIKYTADNYDAITNYFYNVQTRVLKQKWPFLYGNEIKYLIDNKWLEMEWEDLEDWAQESARHVDDEDYIETDLFEDLTLVDPRGPDAPRQRSNLS